MSQSLNVISAIGIAGWIALAISLVGIGATIEDVWRTWPEKGNSSHWQRVALTRIFALASGAVFSAVVAGSANVRNAALQRQLAITGVVAQAAQRGVDSSRIDIAKLRNTTKALAKESREALDAANAETLNAKRNAASVARLNRETQQRLLRTTLLAKSSAATAAASQQVAQRAESDASWSKAVAQTASSNALASQRAAVAAAVKAHVYRLPDKTIVSIVSALSEIPTNATIFIACAPGLEEVCGQVASAAQSLGLKPLVREGQSFWSAGFDDDPLAQTANPNITVAFMERYAKPAHEINEAFLVTGLRTDLVALPANTVKPNLEINFIFVGDAPK